MNLQPIQEALDWYADTFEAVRRERAVAITCAKGCSACCSEPLELTEPEVWLALSKLTEEEKARVAERTAQWMDKAEAAKLDEMPDPINAFAYRALNLVCPLLENGICMAYAQRPFGCRAFRVSGPRVACEDLKLRPNQKFCQTPELDRAGERRLSDAIVEVAEVEGWKMVRISHMGFLLALNLGLGVEET